MKKRLKPKNVVDEDEDSSALEAVSGWMNHENEKERWAAAEPYDGVLGSLPDWMGPEIQGEFTRVRNNLLRSNYAGLKVTPELARLWVDRFCRLGEVDPPEHIPDHHYHQVEQLAHWRWVYSQGQAKAETLIASPGLVENAGVGRKHKTKQQEIAKRSRATPFDAVFGRLLARHYSDWTNKELWNQLISFSDESGVIIKEVAEPLRLEWEDDETGKTGTLLHTSFASKLAIQRRKHGQLKRGFVQSSLQYSLHLSSMQASPGDSSLPFLWG